MEERGPPEDDPPLPPPPLLPLKPPPGYRSGTYVVQIPKDQIYRVPPPENALIAERYRNPTHGKNNNNGKKILQRVLWMFLALFIVALAIGVTTGGLYFYVSPKNPEFSIAHVVVHGTQKKSSHPKSEYEIFLKAKNPNEKLGISYEKGGGASLSFKQNKIATGKFPELHQEVKTMTTVRLILDTSNNTKLIREIKTSMEETMKKKKKKKDESVSLDLKVNVPVRKKFGSMNLWSTEIGIDCNFKLNTLAAAGTTKVISQECRTES